MSKFRRLKSLNTDEIEDFTKLNNSIPKSLKVILSRDQSDINKVIIKIQSTVETLIIESDTGKDFTFKSIDLTESQLYNITLSKGFQNETENEDSNGSVEDSCFPLPPIEKIEKLDYLPKSVKFFKVDAGGSESTKSYEIEPTLLVDFFKVYTNFIVESEIGSLRPDLHNYKLSTGRCTNHN